MPGAKGMQIKHFFFIKCSFSDTFVRDWTMRSALIGDIKLIFKMLLNWHRVVFKVSGTFEDI